MRFTYGRPITVTGLKVFVCVCERVFVGLASAMFDIEYGFLGGKGDGATGTEMAK